MSKDVNFCQIFIFLLKTQTILLLCCRADSRRCLILLFSVAKLSLTLFIDKKWYLLLLTNIVILVLSLGV